MVIGGAVEAGFVGMLTGGVGEVATGGGLLATIGEVWSGIWTLFGAGEDASGASTAPTQLGGAYRGVSLGTKLTTCLQIL